MSEKFQPSKRVLPKNRANRAKNGGAKSSAKGNIFSRHLPLWIFGGVLVVVAVVVGVLVFTPSSQTDPLDKSQGPTDAKVVVTEYGDFQCPACKDFALGVSPKIINDFADKGLVRFNFRQMAFIGPESTLAAEASECANEQGHFWDYYETLYQNQGGENVGNFTNESLSGYADQLKMDTAKFKTCLTSHKYRAKVQRETADGQNKGVIQTPSVMINDKLVEWGGDYTTLQALITQAVANTK